MDNLNNNSKKSAKDDSDIPFMLKGMSVPQVTQNEIDSVCKKAVLYYTKNQGVRSMDFWKVVLSCLNIKSVFLWLASVFILGSFIVNNLLKSGFEVEPFAILITISPIPMLIFAIRELQYRDVNLVQLEKTCRYAPNNIYFARLWVGTICNAGLIGIIGLLFTPFCQSVIRLYLLSFIAMFMVGAAALIFMSYLNNAFPLSVMLSFWIIGAYALLCQIEIIDILLKMSIAVMTTLAFISILVFICVTIHSTKKLYT